jgi:hypothetical protein
LINEKKTIFMKRKILLAISIFLSASSTTYTIQAQGIYSRKNSPVATSEQVRRQGIWGAPPPGNTTITPGQGAGGQSPIGDGLAVLVMLAGGYFLSKKLKNNKVK